MAKEGLNLTGRVDAALRGVVRDALAYVVDHGLSGQHHFYISFRTDSAGVVLPSHLRQRYPEEMTIVLQHQFWNLEVKEQGFEVTLSFNNVQEYLFVPFAAITAFADPSVQFGLQFSPQQAPSFARRPAAAAVQAAEAAAPAGAPGSDGGQVVALDKFRRK
ncbi:MAG: hypothetical protein FJX56_04650 [Alphaproteobacteria bacterium]|nr:hypothetical protein [Alphaproteobacteria bacterium]